MEFLLILGPLALIAAILLWLARRADRRYEESARWPQVDAVIIQSKINRNGKGGRWPAIRYEYQFCGQDYTGSRLTFVQQNLGPAQCAELMTLYPVGKPVKAYVDDNNPSYAVLERTSSGGRSLRVTVAIISAIFLIAFAAVLLSK